MNILLINGSVAKKSHTEALLQYIASLFEKKDVTTKWWNLKEKPMLVVLPEYHHNPMDHPDRMVHEFVRAVEQVDGIVLGSPLYHGSYAGVLKNALDNLHFDTFRGKWIGLVGNGGSIRADHVQLVHLRQVVKTLYGYTLQTQVGTCAQDYEEQESGFTLNNKEIIKRCQRLVDEMIKLLT
ncbi:NAD(P)H-dependent oxidoreductase [Candidatus Woesebacteria bacterium]|nr:NAD(P)H-dependent oxidoreductase [Candidatus Woesebacteria bacterium]